jgi:hypothetical protein
MFLLEPHSEYSVTVNAVNGAGNGSSVTKTARTNEHGWYYLLLIYSSNIVTVLFNHRNCSNLWTRRNIHVITATVNVLLLAISQIGSAKNNITIGNQISVAKVTSKVSF